MRLAIFAGVALATALAHPAIAQSRNPNSPVGTWRGTSTCLVRPSACQDEIAVYHISATKTTDSLALDGRKLVGGEEQEMGVLVCEFTAANGQITCNIPQGVWRFTVRNDSLTGELRGRDNTRTRVVHTIRVP
jgi:hypothetical protein